MGFCNKVSYPDKLSARIAGAQLSHKTGERYRAYYCEYHNTWHLTSQKKGRYAKKDRPAKQGSYRKRAILEAAEESELRQLRDVRQWNANIPGQSSGETIVEEEL